MLHKTFNTIIFAKSDKAETSSAGEQLERNNLINENTDEVGANLTSVFNQYFCLKCLKKLK